MASKLLNRLTRRMAPATRVNLMIRTFSWMRIPLIFWTGATVVAIDDEHCVIRMPFRRRNRNHLNSLYFGVLMVGADLAGGLLALTKTRERGRAVRFAFKDARAEFLKRAEGDTFFRCDDGVVVDRALDETFATGERVNQTVRVVATTPDQSDEPVATFELTLSVKAVGPRPETDPT